MKAIQLLAASVVISSSLLGCGGDSLNRQATTFSQSPGVWQDKHTGEILLVDSESLRTFHSTETSCVQTTSPVGIDIADNNYTLESIRGGKINYLKSTKNDSKISASQVYSNLNALPVACNSETLELTQIQVFEHMWQSINQYYPFLDDRNIDWNALYTKHRNTINDDTSHQALVELLTEMLAEIDDPLVEISATYNQTPEIINPSKTKGWHRIADRLSDMESIPYSLAFNHLTFTFNEALERSYSTGSINTIANTSTENAISWGVLEGNTGYLQINTFDGYSIEGSIDAEIENFTQIINNVIDNLKNTNQLILDLRFNRTEKNEVAFVLANYFSTPNTVALKDTTYEEMNVFINWAFAESDRNYTQPVGIIQSSTTQGAAELLMLSLNENTNIATFGEQTRGSIGPSYEIPLNNNFTLRFPFRRYISAGTNESFQTNGIQADYTSPASSYSATDLTILPSIHFALENMGVDLSLTEDDFISRVNDVLGEDIPGMASAIVTPTSTREYGFGFANIETEEHVTSNTPFKVGSISKTMIGVAAMQTVENFGIDLDWSLNDIAFPISINGDAVNNQTITLRQLATHISGITDGSDYLCTYVIDDANSHLANADLANTSLTEAFDIYECPFGVTTDTREFLSEYFSPGGIFYNDIENFNGNQAGEKWEYSNVGATVMAEALHHVSGTSFDEWTKHNIFLPLSMDNTGWFNSDFPDTNLPAQPYALLEDERITIPRHSLATWADGDLRTSAKDLSRFLQTIVNHGESNDGRILEESSVQHMLSSQTDADILEEQGLFWFNDGVIMGHSGGDPGAMAHMYYDQFNQVGYIVMLNVSGEDDYSEMLLNEKFERLNHLTYRRGLSFKNEQR